MAHWHDFNPWADVIVYVPDLEEFASCIEGIGRLCTRLYPDGTSETFIQTIEHHIENWKLCSRNRGGKGHLDAYILPQPSRLHDIGVRYGRKPEDYFSPMGNRAKVEALLHKYGPKMVRDHECPNGHKWTAEVVLSEHTQNLSSEATQWCPKCNRRAFISSPARAKSHA